MNKINPLKSFLVIVFSLTALAAVFFLFIIKRAEKPLKDGKDYKGMVEDTWRGYKHYFIDRDGRVKRIKDGDSVSEGQAYAMLRAVWMGDKEVFDKCYIWTEKNLSRIKIKGDNLLAWHWKDGAVVDWMPASDADVDYALSLVFANAKWRSCAPAGLKDYGEKAKEILNDILRFETYKTSKGRLYLSPWILEDKENIKRFPVNPSYYSPAHFRIFYEYTKDKNWLELVDTAYFILSTLSKEFNGEKGVGLIPDWCSVDEVDKFYPLKGKNDGFGWEAVRVPFRVGLDFFWFDSKDAKEFFNSGLSQFIEKQWQDNGLIFSEYNYNGVAKNRYENPLFYASYCVSLRISGSSYYRDLLHKTRLYIKKYPDGWVYDSPEEYYVNSLAWLIEGIDSGNVKNLFKPSF